MRSPPACLSEMISRPRFFFSPASAPWQVCRSQPSSLAISLIDATSLQHRDEAGLLAVGARRLRLLSRGRPARLPASAIDGGAQDAQDVVGPGLARALQLGLQPMLGGLACSEQLLPSAPTVVWRSSAGFGRCWAQPSLDLSSSAVCRRRARPATGASRPFGDVVAASSPGSSVAPSSRSVARKSSALIRPSSKPAAASRMSSTVQPSSSAWRRIAASAAALLAGLRGLAVERAQDGGQLGSGEVGHRRLVLGPRRLRRHYWPQPAGEPMQG